MARHVRSVLVAVVLLAGLSVSARGSAAAIIQPGAPIQIGTSLCTLNWIYDGGGATYAGTAGHCAEHVGDRVFLDEAGGAPGGFGYVAFISPNLDYSLIRIDTAELGHVSPAMRGHPNIPTGVSTTFTAAVGDTMQFSGYGVVVGVLQPTREGRVGILGANDGQQHYIYGLITPGDSGGPVADVSDGNKAFGIVDTVGVAINPGVQAGEGGVSVEGLMLDAASFGFPIKLRTV
jgi:hypothetical protein